MRTVDAAELAADFDSLLSEVERGATIAIRKDGKVVAQFSSLSDAEVLQRRKQAFENIRALRARVKPMSIDEILAARDEGRK
jgi:antitoxin (DNA-binding transcriptional repressor) of toxin-antitoxin stability system